MFVELLMKKNGKIIFVLFLILTIAASIFGGVLVYDAMNTDVYEFTKDGYALTFSTQNNTKALAYSFKNGTEYQFKKNSNTINFEFEEEKVRLDENTIMHYSDGSLGVLKKVVGIDLSTVDRNIIFYYNIYKDTKINATADGHSIKLANDNEVKFKHLLMRISDNKFILSGKNVRLVLSKDNIIDFGEYVEFEYMDGNVVKVYNHDKFYQTISSESHLLVGDVKINLSEAIISKNNKDYISLTNLVVDNDGNIDALEEIIEKDKVYIEDGDVDVPAISIPDTSIVDGGKEEGDNSGTLDDENQKEEVVDKNKIENTPSYKVSEFTVSALKVEAKIDIVDVDNLINSDTTVQIVENKTAKVIYEDSGTRGDAQVTLSCADLQPDTEYTLYARASYVIDGVEIERIFLSKLFRTEDLGVSFEASLVTSTGLSIDIIREPYSKVNSVLIELYKENGDLAESQNVRFQNGDTETLEFYALDSNSDYVVKMTQISSQNVVVDDGYSVSKTVRTLKEKPTIGDLAFEIDKKNGAFNLIVSSVNDPDYGIINYRYEVYFVEDGVAQETPATVVNKSNLDTAVAKVDGTDLVRDRLYTYVLVAEFNDNEKIVEYSKELGYTMSLTGFRYPTIRVDNGSSNLTWEKYESTIIIEDVDGVIQSNEFTLTYKNSIDVSTTKIVTSGRNQDDEYTIPVAVNGLRADDTYTFQVSGTIDLGDGNGPVTAYIGSVYVQTTEPQPLAAAVAPTGDQTQIFSLKVNLENPEGMDSSYEASTISKITFHLYRGSNVEGEPFRSLTLTDGNGKPYESDLADTLYSGSGIVLTPASFNAVESDFTEQKYTLVIDDVYDYTKHPNEIPITEDTKKYTFDLSAALPTIPEDHEDAVYITAITNKNANTYGLSTRSELANNTVFAYALTPKFDNRGRTARTINWTVHMYDKESNDYIELTNLKRIKTVSADSESLPYTIFELSPGTGMETIDNDTLRRGNTYKFGYTIELDVNNQKMQYPEDIEGGEGVVLTSKKIETVKQSATIEMYPSYSTDVSEGVYKYVWKYRIYDLDNALVQNEYDQKTLEIYQDGSAIARSAGVVETENDLIGGTIRDLDFKTVEFGNLEGDKITYIQKSEILNKNARVETDILMTQYFDGIKKISTLNYEIKKDTNRLIIEFANDEENQKVLNSIASVNVIVKPVDTNVSPSEIRFNGQMLTSNTIIIDFLKIADYLNQEIKVELEVFYDTGRAGFDLETQFGGSVAIQEVPLTETDKRYYKLSGDNLSGSYTLNGSMYTTNLQFNQTGYHQLRLTPFEGTTKNITVTMGKSGILYNKQNYIIPKQLATESITGGNSITFDKIIPGISVHDASGKQTVTGLLTQATIDAEIIDNIKSPINQEKGIEVELYTVTNTSETYVDTFKYTLRDLDNQVTIEDLNPNTKYGVKFFAYIFDANAVDTEYYTRVQLYDVDKYTNDIRYDFITIQEVEITNIKSLFIERAYNDKRLQISFQPSIVYGYKGIDVTLKTLSGQVIATNHETSLTTSMTSYFQANPGVAQSILYGNEYIVELSPYSQPTADDEKKILNTASAIITIPTAQQPTIGIRTAKTDSTISFTVSISDLDYVAIGGKYDYELKDSKGEIIATTVGTTNQQLTAVKNVTFSFDRETYNLEEGENYTFTVITQIDTKNDGNATTYKMGKSMVFGSSLNTGTITASKNISNALAIDLVFQDSYKLTETVKSIQYTITNYDNEFSYSETLSFNNSNVVYNPSTKLYYYTLTIPTTETNYKINNVYIISLNFYDSDGALVSQSEVTYYYN